MREDLLAGSADDAPWIADAACVEAPLEVPERTKPKCADARRALIWAILGVVCFGVVFGPLALAVGHRARLTLAAQPELGGARTARIAIALGRVGLALHLTLLLTALPWLLFALPLVGGFGG
jgi:hypothetical protein